MIITELLKNGQEFYKLHIDYEFICFVDDETAYKFKLKKGMEISESDLEEIKTLSEYKNAKNDCAKILSRSCKPKIEVKQKLRFKGYKAETIDKVIQFFEGAGFIDDEKYARAYTNDAIKLKKIGKMRIVNELKKKGISSDIITMVTDNISCGENLKDLVKKELAKYSDRDRKTLDKIRRKLYLKGYSIWDINATIGEYNDEYEV